MLFSMLFFCLLVHFLDIRGWTKGKAAIGEVLPAPWKLRKLFVPLLPAAAAAVHLDCIWLSAFFSCQKGRRNYIWKDQRRQVRLSISLHFVILWVCVCMRGGCVPRTPKGPPLFLYLHSKIMITPHRNGNKRLLINQVTDASFASEINGGRRRAEGTLRL